MLLSGKRGLPAGNLIKVFSPTGYPLPDFIQY